MKLALYVDHWGILVNFYIWYELGIQLHSFACGYLVIPGQFVEESILFPLNGLDTLLKIE